MTTLYGIKNCDTIKKARKWLEANNVDYQFHDYRVDGITKDWLTRASQDLGWKALLNTRGTTYRKLDEATKAAIDEELAISLMLESPAMIKRPLLESEETKILGFTPEKYTEILL